MINEKNKNSKNDFFENNQINILEKDLKELKKKTKTIELSNMEEIIKIKNRINSDIEKAQKFSLEKIVVEFLPIIDNIERALNLLKKEKEDTYLEVIKNMQFILSLFHEVLNELKISKINDINISFNPDIHQAMSINYTDSVPENQVVSIMQSGYILHQSRLLRPAMVVVSKNKK